MSEEQQQETVVQEAVADMQQQDTSQEVQVATEPKSQEDSQDRNWRETRQVIELLKNRTDALEAENARLRTPSPKQEPEEVYTDEDISTVGMTKKLLRKQEEKLEQLKEEFKRRDALTVEDRVRSKYADYDQVVSKDNLESLFSTAPELVKMLKANQDHPYDQAVAAYKLMKQFGVSSEDAAKLKENQSKPRSVNSVGQTSALSQANAFSRGLTPDLRKQLWQEMKEAAKQA